MKLSGIKLFLLACFLALAAFAGYLPDLKDYGPTWDEFFHRPTGKQYLDYFRTGNKEKILSLQKASWLPPVASILGQIFIENIALNKIYPMETDRFHLAAVFYASVIVATVFLITFLVLGNIWLSLGAAMLLFFHPQFAVQAHTNVRDMGLVMFFTLTIFSLMLSVRNRGGSLIWAALSGLLTGLALDSKQNGIYLLFIALIWLFVNKKILGKRLLPAIILYLFTAAISFFIFWPYLWFDTLNHLQLAWEYLRSESIMAGSLTFYGQTYYSMRNIPFYYPFVMLFIVTQPLISGAAVIGLYGSFRGLKGKPKEGMLFLWLFIPLIRYYIPSTAISHDQIRHFLEVLPAVPILACLTLSYLYKFAQTYKLKYLTVSTHILIAVMILYNAYLYFAYRPYGSAYFNFLAGSPDYVTQSFDVEYWGNVYREATKYLNNQYGQKKTFLMPGLGTHLLLENGFKGKITEDFNSEYDYVIFMNKRNWINDRPYLIWLLSNKKPIFTISRGGKILFYQFKPYKEDYIQRGG